MSNEGARDANKRPDGKGWQGPTYADVRAIASDLERTFSCKVDFLLGPEDVAARWDRSRMWVRCRAYTGSDPWKGAVWGSMPLGGNTGAKTLPAAMLKAMEDVWEELSARGFFPEEAIDA